MAMRLPSVIALKDYIPAAAQARLHPVQRVPARRLRLPVLRRPLPDPRPDLRPRHPPQPRRPDHLGERRHRLRPLQPAQGQQAAARMPHAPALAAARSRPPGSCRRTAAPSRRTTCTRAGATTSTGTANWRADSSRPNRRPLLQERVDPLRRIPLPHVPDHDVRGVRIRVRELHLRLPVKRRLAQRHHRPALRRDLPGQRPHRIVQRAFGTARFTIPNRTASSAETISPVSSISIAALRPTARVSATIGVEQNRPIFTPGVAKRALSAAIARSHVATNWHPLPSLPHAPARSPASAAR